MGWRDDAKVSCFFVLFPMESLYVELNGLSDLRSSTAPLHRHVSCLAHSWLIRNWGCRCRHPARGHLEGGRVWYENGPWRNKVRFWGGGVIFAQNRIGWQASMNRAAESGFGPDIIVFFCPRSKGKFGYNIFICIDLPEKNKWIVEQEQTILFLKVI